MIQKPNDKSLRRSGCVLLFCCAQASKVVYNYSFHAHVQILRGSGESIIMCPVKHPEKG